MGKMLHSSIYCWMLSLNIYFIKCLAQFFSNYLNIYSNDWPISSWGTDLVVAALQIHGWFSAGALWVPGTHGSASASENQWLRDTCVPKQVENLLRIFFYILSNTSLIEVWQQLHELALFISPILFPFSVFSQHHTHRFKKNPIHISTNDTVAQLLLRGGSCGFSLWEWCSEGRYRCPK